MPILVHLDELLHARRMTLSQLSSLVDISLANLSILKTGKARAVRFSTLEAICEALDCQPGDLLEYRHKDGTGDREQIVKYRFGTRSAPQDKVA